MLNVSPNVTAQTTLEHTANLDETKEDNWPFLTQHKQVAKVLTKDALTLCIPGPE